jgi:hypothetical protein
LAPQLSRGSASALEADRGREKKQVDDPRSHRGAVAAIDRSVEANCWHRSHFAAAPEEEPLGLVNHAVLREIVGPQRERL